jgi:predicted metal-dependent phosphoesterase TrpH
MPISTTELNEFLNNHKYARFVHTNLHLHTPATPWDWDSREDQTTKAARITPEIYFEALNRTSLELVAITDHNSVNWCQTLISLAKLARQEGKSSIHVLPGVEVTTYEGPHLLAIFDESKEIEELRLMIARLGMSGRGEAADRVGDKSGRTVAIKEILSEVDNLGGIVIAPHVNEKDGLWGPKEFKGRKKY